MDPLLNDGGKEATRLFRASMQLLTRLANAKSKRYDQGMEEVELSFPVAKDNALGYGRKKNKHDKDFLPFAMLPTIVDCLTSSFIQIGLLPAYNLKREKGVGHAYSGQLGTKTIDNDEVLTIVEVSEAEHKLFGISTHTENGVISDISLCAYALKKHINYLRKHPQIMKDITDTEARRGLARKQLEELRRMYGDGPIPR